MNVFFFISEGYRGRFSEKKKIEKQHGRSHLKGSEKLLKKFTIHLDIFG